MGTSNQDFLYRNNKLTYNLSYLYFGCSSTRTANPSRNGFLMRFDLRDKPNNWETCEISLYLYRISGGQLSAYMYLFEGNWTEEEWNEFNVSVKLSAD